jgi:hypothetical protein
MHLTRSATRFLVGNSSVLLLAIILGAQAARAEVVVEDPLALQFARARNMTIVRELADLPPDVDRILKEAFAMSGLAKIGESWNNTDMVGTSEPLGQFLYAALTEEIAAVVLISGGFGVSAQVILAERDATSYCHYTLGKFSSGFLSLAGVQGKFDATAPDRSTPPPKCMRRKMPSAAPAARD